MGSYYYLVAQLPALSYGTQPPMDSERFGELCDQLLNPEDRELLKYCSLDPDPELPDDEQAAYADIPAPCGSSFIDAWRNWERTLRLHLAHLRAQKIRRDASTLADAPADPLDAAAAAKSAMNYESPLEAELFLDQARWKAVEALQGFDYFGRESVYAYLLKLCLIERRTRFDPEEGFKEYKGLYESIIATAPTSILSGEPK